MMEYNFDKKQFTEAEKYVNILLKYKKYVAKNIHPNLLPFWERTLKRINDKNIRKFKENGNNIKSRSDACEKAPKFGLPRIFRYKTMTLRACLPKSICEKVLDEIKNALDNKKEYINSWVYKYNYFLQITFRNGTGFAFLEQRCKKSLFGRYWIVINYNNCVYSSGG